MLAAWNSGPRGEVHPMTRVSARLLDEFEDWLAAQARLWVKGRIQQHPSVGKTLR